MQSSDGFGKKLGKGRDSLCNLAIENGYSIYVRNIEGHIALQHTVIADNTRDIVRQSANALHVDTDSIVFYAPDKFLSAELTNLTQICYFLSLCDLAP